MQKIKKIPQNISIVDIHAMRDSLNELIDYHNDLVDAEEARLEAKVGMKDEPAAKNRTR